MNIVNVGYSSTNYYVLGLGRGRLLVDIGWPGTLHRMLAELKRKGIDPHDIGYMLATHYHPDHAGLAEDLKAHGPRLIVLESQRTAIDLLKTYVKPRDNFTAITLKHTHQLTFATSAAFLHSIGIAGEIISTPGHSPDSVTLVLANGVAFTGDLPPAHMVDPDATPEVANSWAAIRAAGATTIYPAHGPVWQLLAN